MLTEERAREFVKHSNGTINGKVISIKHPDLKTISAIDCLVKNYGYRIDESSKRKKRIK